VTRAEGRRDERAQQGGGWGDFATVVFAIAGISNGIQGLSALFKKEYFNEAGLAYSNLRFWAIVWLIVGVLQIGAASLLVGRAKSGRKLGIVLAAGSVIVAFLSLGGHQSWSLAILAMDILIVYGLTAHPDAYAEGQGAGDGPGPVSMERMDMMPPTPR
jgi:hypothetical protein